MIPIHKFRRLKEGDGISAQEWNALVAIAEAVQKSSMPNGIINSAGIHTRRTPGTSSYELKIYRRQENYDLEGVYICYQQVWNGTEFVNLDQVPVLCRNVLETSGHIFNDNCLFKRIGNPVQNDHIPVVPFGYFEIRWAYCKEDAGEDDTIDCYLDVDGTGEEITVYCNLSGIINLYEASRLLKDGDILPVYYDIDEDKWRSVEAFYVTSEIRNAYCKNDAGSSSTITCYLDTDGTGEEITVYCNISGGSNLDSAVRRLEDGDLLQVRYDSANSKWRALEGFQASKNCEGT